eukprot:514204-Pelagomonas_calceolata.AAC.4
MQNAGAGLFAASRMRRVSALHVCTAALQGIGSLKPSALHGQAPVTSSYSSSQIRHRWKYSARLAHTHTHSRMVTGGTGTRGGAAARPFARGSLTFKSQLEPHQPQEEWQRLFAGKLKV